MWREPAKRSISSPSSPLAVPQHQSWAARASAARSRTSSRAACCPRSSRRGVSPSWGAPWPPASAVLHACEPSSHAPQVVLRPCVYGASRSGYNDTIPLSPDPGIHVSVACHASWADLQQPPALLSTMRLTEGVAHDPLTLRAYFDLNCRQDLYDYDEEEETPEQQAQHESDVAHLLAVVRSDEDTGAGQQQEGGVVPRRGSRRRRSRAEWERG